MILASQKNLQLAVDQVLQKLTMLRYIDRNSSGDRLEGTEALHPQDENAGKAQAGQGVQSLSHRGRGELVPRKCYPAKNDAKRTRLPRKSSSVSA